MMLTYYAGKELGLAKRQHVNPSLYTDQFGSEMVPRSTSKGQVVEVCDEGGQLLWHFGVFVCGLGNFFAGKLNLILISSEIWRCRGRK